MTKGKKKKELILTAETAGYKATLRPAGTKGGLLKGLPKEKAGGAADAPQEGMEDFSPVHYSKVFISNLLGRKPWEAPYISKTFREIYKTQNPEESEAIITALQEGEALPRPRLSGEQWNLIRALQITLKEQSKEHWNPKREGYYTGAQQEISRWEVNGRLYHVSSPVLTFDLYTLAKTYTGKKHPSGRHMEVIHNLLQSLARETYTLWTAVPTGEKVSKKTKKAEPTYSLTTSCSPLIWFLETKTERLLTITEEGSVLFDLERPETFSVMLHPILTDFSRGYVPIEEAIVRQIKPGEHRGLFAAMISEHLQEKEWSIGEDKLFKQIFPGFFEQRRRGRMQELLQDAVEIYKQSGQLLEAFPSKMKNGEIKWVFRFPQKDS
jgi:hypothetical protein